MKKLFANLALLFKKLSFLYRLIGLAIAGYVVFGMAIPDIRFNMTTGKVVEMSLDQLMKTPADDIPRYLKIKDAVVPSGSYVEFRKSKSNSLTGIYYPVYPSSDVKVDLKDLNKVTSSDSMKVIADSLGQISLMKDTDSINAKLVINDSQVTDADLDSTGTYFNNPKFTIEGKYDGEKLGTEVIKLFKESGMNVSSDAIVLSRGEKGMDTNKASIFAILGLLVMVIGVISFIPEEKLKSWL